MTGVMERNEASLPAGRLFLNVAMWDPEVLTDHREQLQTAVLLCGWLQRHHRTDQVGVC